MIKKCILLVFLIFMVHTTVMAEEAAIPGENFFNETTQQITTGKFSLHPVELINKGIKSFLKEMSESRDMMITIIVLAALSGVVGVLQSAMKDSKISEGAFFACFTLMAAVAVRCFSLALGYAQNVITAMTDFVTKLSPLFIGLLVSSGTVTSAAAFHPVLSGAVYVITVITDKCIFPLVQLGAVLSIVNNISGRVQISGFNSLINSLTKWILTAVLTIFTGITAIYGFSSPLLDGISAKAVKFAVGSLVPVVGGLLTDAVETVVGGTQLMKNAVGTAGMAAMCVMCVVPIMKISVILLMLKFAAAMTEPMADRKVTGLLRDISSSVTMVLGLVITTAVLFVICISIILASTNIRI